MNEETKGRKETRHDACPLVTNGEAHREDDVQKFGVDNLADENRQQTDDTSTNICGL